VSKQIWQTSSSSIHDKRYSSAFISFLHGQAHVPRNFTRSEGYIVVPSASFVQRYSRRDLAAGHAYYYSSGWLSFFAKACAIALTEWPTVNAFIDGDQLLYHDYADISIAVSTPRGLTVPVIRNVESLSMAEIEKSVVVLAGKARDSKLTTEDLTGGTFTITNGGVFGSLMSTPIINFPQSAILGMHKIQDRPMAVDGEVKILPMMYLALSYDHRIIDGRESVGFLVRVKALLENPSLLLIGKDPVASLLEL